MLQKPEEGCCYVPFFLSYHVRSAVGLRNTEICALWLKVCFSLNVKPGVCYCRARDCRSWNCQFGVPSCFPQAPPFEIEQMTFSECWACTVKVTFAGRGRELSATGTQRVQAGGHPLHCAQSCSLPPESRSLCPARCCRSNSACFSLEIRVWRKDLKKSGLVRERQANFPSNTRDSWLKSRTLVFR